MQFADLVRALQTISAISVTPFSADGSIDFVSCRRIVDRMVGAGITVVTPNGNTGEFYALTPAECCRAVEMTVEAVAHRALVMAGVGHDVATAIELGHFAGVVGARAVMVHQPVHPSQSADGWIAYHAAIANALPSMGIVPYVRDPNVTAAMLTRLAECPNVVGMKYAVPDPLQFAALIQAVGPDRLAWICGLAEVWAPFFWPAGAEGFTSGLVNVDATASLQMLGHLRSGYYARAMDIWRRIRPFEDLRARRNNANNVPVVKEALAQLGLCGRTVRPPMSELPISERTEVAEMLASMGIRQPTSPGV